MSLNTLNDQLVHASKKFAKACDQIKILKQRIAELLRMFSYCDPSLPSNNYNTNANNYTNNTNSTNNSLNTATQISDTNTNFNTNVFKDTIRQQIETLQSVKTAYFIYAQKKADEITRLQCELYGEDAVRIAYENASPEALISASSNDNQSQEQQQQQDQNNNESANDIPVATPSTNDETIYEQTLPLSDSSAIMATNEQTYWTPWNFGANQETPMNDRMQFRQANTSNTQVQLIEYDFLTA
jgi:hypothetical protein